MKYQHRNLPSCGAACQSPASYTECRKPVPTSPPTHPHCVCRSLTFTFSGHLGYQFKQMNNNSLMNLCVPSGISEIFLLVKKTCREIVYPCFDSQKCYFNWWNYAGSPWSAAGPSPPECALFTIAALCTISRIKSIFFPHVVSKLLSLSVLQAGSSFHSVTRVLAVISFY